MTYTAADLAAVRAAIASGEKSVQLDGKAVTYRSIAELLAAERVIAGELQAAGLLAAPARGGTTLAICSRD